MTDNLADAVEVSAGRLLDDLVTPEVLDVAAQLRAIVAALPPTNPWEAHLCALLTEAAELVERRARIA
ncbi:MAG: hypothetical protein ABSB09_02905 [Acidimicrobiales bacterium]